MSALAEILKRVDVLPNGSITMGNFVNADGFAKKQVRAITHAHQDHLGELGKSYSYQGKLLMTPETYAYLTSLYNFRGTRSKVNVIRYGSYIKIWDEKVTFLRAEHIPGSAQVLVENDRGLRVLYSGDFKNPGIGTEILEDGVDILIVDATYGCPKLIRSYKERMVEILIDVVEKALSANTKLVFYTYYGKSEEVILLLREWGFDLPVVVNKRHYKLIKELESLGFKFGDVLTEEQALEERLEEAFFFVHFNKISKDPSAFRKDAANLVLSGWFFEPYRRVAENVWEVGFSDHADFEDTIHYIISHRPALVITDGFRSSKCASALARYLRFKYGIMAVARPGGATQ